MLGISATSYPAFRADAKTFLSIYNPDNQIAVAHTEKPQPTIKEVEENYGKETAESWLELQLFNLMDFMGIEVELDNNLFDQLAVQMRTEFSWLTLKDYAQFFCNFKKGVYGHFYKRADCSLILHGLLQYTMDCQRKKNQEELEARMKRDAEYYKDHTPLDDYKDYLAHKQFYLSQVK